MKKIFIASHCMELGGAERSLLGILNSIDYKNYEVDLFLYRHTGELLKYIPEEVNLLPEDKQMSMLAIPFSNVIKKGQFSMAWGRYKGKRKALEFDKENVNGQESMVMLEYSHKYTIPCVKRTINKTYDLAISFLTPHYYVAEKIDAKVKLAWIHTDYSNYLLDVKSELQMWSRYDYIASISPKCTEGFLKVFPELKDKIIEISNINAEHLIRMQSKEKITDDMQVKSGEICLCSIGRFAYAKNFDHIPAKRCPCRASPAHGARRQSWPAPRPRPCARQTKSPARQPEGGASPAGCWQSVLSSNPCSILCEAYFILL